MSGSTNFPATGFRFVDGAGRLTQQARQFFVAMYNRAGGSTTSAVALETGNSSVPFACANAAASDQAIPLGQYRSQAGQPPSSVSAGTSPWTYAAPSNGTLIISGGTVSDIEFQRDGIVAQAGVTAGPLPLRAGDALIITYSAAPSMTWLPN